MIVPGFILAGALMVAAPHTTTTAEGLAGVSARPSPATLRLEAAPSSATGVCEGSLSPIGIVLPAGAGSAKCDAPLRLRHDWREGEPGTYVLLDLPSCPDSWCRPLQMEDGLRCEILIGNPCCLQEPLGRKELRAYPGARIGPVSDALRGRFDADTDRRVGICIDDYRGNMARVLRVLIVEPTSRAGRSAYRVLGGARLFLRERQDKSDDLVGDVVPVP